MRCPLIVNQYGNPQYCEERHCAWWDVKNSQCLVTTFLLKNTEDPIQKLVNESKEGYIWDR